MPDLQKVLQGLSACSPSYVKWCQMHEKELCEYNGMGYCMKHLLNDARELVERLVPRVMTLEEVNAYCSKDEPLAISDNPPLYVEYKKPNPAFRRWETVETLESWLNVFSLGRDYGTKWRCWTSAPTEEQMKEFLWDD